VDAQDGITPVTAADDGTLLSREPHGFPGAVAVVGLETGTLASLRLARTLSLVAAARGHAFATLEAEVIDAGQTDLSHRAGGRLEVRLPRSWLREHGGSTAALRAAVGQLFEALPASDTPKQGTGPDTGQEPPAARARVLLFRNPFTKDVDRGDARQLNPGSHHLISALEVAGHRTVLLDAKLPLQDACTRPPHLDDPLAEDQVLTDPGELQKALVDHPDIDLICITLLERCVGQVRELCRWIRRHSDAWIAVGGPLPTAAPEHCLAHLPEVDVVVRGDGEIVLPTLAAELAGVARGEGPDPASWSRLAALDGVALRGGGRLLCAHLDRVNRVPDLDSSPLSMDLLAREQVEGGLSLTTSRGCVYACRFCSVHDRQHWRAMSAERVLSQLAEYRSRLATLHGKGIPGGAMRLQLWDDDFFIDPERAAAILRGIRSAGHEIAFLQGTVASFFRRTGKRDEWQLDEELLDAIPRDAFSRTGGLKLGTESFCDRELRRLGKPYRVAQIRQLVAALARRGIRQDHYLVLCNRETSLDDLLDGLETIAELRWRAGPGFSVLQPSWLIHLFPTALHRTAQRRGRARELPTAGCLHAPGYPEYDYPLVMPERPGRPEVFEVVRRLPAGMHFGAAGPVDDPIEGVHDGGDWGYTHVFDGIRRVLSRRLGELAGDPRPAAGAERARIRAALDGRLRRAPGLTVGLAGRLSPALEPPPGRADESDLSDYLETLLGRAGGATGARVEQRVGAGGPQLRTWVDDHPVDLSVSRRGKGPAAAHTRNLALVVRSPTDTEEERRRAGIAIERVRAVLDPLDREDLP